MPRTVRSPLLLLLTLLAPAACDQATPSTGPDVSAQLAVGGNSAPGFITSAPAQAELLVPGTLTPLATAGDVMPDGAQLIGLPDGMGAWGGSRFMNLYLNHEVSGAARVSRFVIDAADLEIDSHAYTLDGSEGYNRLCSAEWVDAGSGFPGGYFFTGEEGGLGRQLAIDAQGNTTELPWIGSYAHENQISVPGFPGHVVVLNFDDNGGSGPGRAGARSELYMYVARNSDEVLRGQGQLYVFAADDAALLPNDLTVNAGVPGHWVAIPDAVARDAGALEAYVDTDDVLAFPFVRVEDGFYDKRSGAGPSAFFYDTGRSRVTDPDDGTAIDPWGSIYRIDFEDPSDPAGGRATLTLLARSTGPADMWASPDNGAMSVDGTIMLQEDPANGPWEATAGARAPAVFRLRLAGDGTLVDPSGEKVAQVTGGDCSDAGPGNCWESSGIIDVSRWFGTGAWLFDVQAHDELVPGCPDCVESGQVLLMRLR